MKVQFRALSSALFIVSNVLLALFATINADEISKFRGSCYGLRDLFIDREFRFTLRKLKRRGNRYVVHYKAHLDPRHKESNTEFKDKSKEYIIKIDKNMQNKKLGIIVYDPWNNMEFKVHQPKSYQFLMLQICKRNNNGSLKVIKQIKPSRRGFFDRRHMGIKAMTMFKWKYKEPIILLLRFNDDFPMGPIGILVYSTK